VSFSTTFGIPSTSPRVISMTAKPRRRPLGVPGTWLLPVLIIDRVGRLA
jgi:hypothetical protein